jgi:excisionase family DNA binding protein
MRQTSTANDHNGRVRTLKEAATILRISRGSAYEAARRGEIPTIRIGRRLLVPSDALERMLSAEHEPERAQPADHRDSNRATFSGGPSSPTPGRGKGSPRQSSTSAVS